MERGGRAKGRKLWVWVGEAKMKGVETRMEKILKVFEVLEEERQVCLMGKVRGL